jgi:hypothetical protein
MVGLIIRKEERKSLYKSLVGNHYKKPLGRPRLKGEDVIKASVKEKDISVTNSAVIKRRLFKCNVK